MGNSRPTRLLLLAAALPPLALCSLVAAAAGWRTAAIVLCSLTLVSAAAAAAYAASRPRRPAPSIPSSPTPALVDALPLAIVVVDATDEIVWANRLCSEMLGLPEQDAACVPGKPLNEAFLPPCFGNWTPLLEKARREGAPTATQPTQFFLEGRKGVCRAWVSPIGAPGENRGLLLIAIQDVTLEAAESSALLEAKEREEGLFEGVPVKIAALDRSFRIVRCNRLMQQWIRDARGLDTDSVHGLPVLDVMPKEFRADWKHILRRVLVEGRAFEQPRVHESVGGTDYFHRVRLYPLLDEEGNVRETLLLYEDVTEYVHLERRLAETTDYLNLLIESVNDGFYALDAEGRYTFCNQEFLNLLGMSNPAELMHKRPQDIVMPEELPKVERMLERRRRGERVFFETQIKRRDGTPAPVLISSSPIFRHGQFTGIVGIAHDLSERKRLEAMVERSHQDLEKAYEELSVLDKMKSDFIAIASHELRTPLSIIKGYADAFQYGELGELNAFQLEKIRIINNRADQMTKIINDLLDVTRLDEGRLVGQRWPAPVAGLIEDAVLEYRGARLRERAEARLPRRRGSPRGKRRSLARAPGYGKPRRQCPQVHPRGRYGGGQRGALRQPRHGGNRGQGYRSGHTRKRTETPVYKILPNRDGLGTLGGRARPRPGNFQGDRGGARRTHLGGERARQGVLLQVHPPHPQGGVG